MATTTVPTVTLADGHSYELKYHDLVPALSDEVFSELCDSIQQHGMMIPVLINRQNEVIDGQHRLKVAKKLGKASTEIPVETWYGDPGDELSLAIDLNLKRRHLGPEDRRRLVGKLKAGGLSNRAIAAQIGVDESTVRRSLERSGEASAAPEQEMEVKTQPVEVKTKGLDGRSYPAEALPANAINRRRAQAGALQDAGKSVREISTELGFSVGTISADLQLRAKMAEANPKTPDEERECCSSQQLETAFEPEPKHEEVTKPVTSAKKSAAPKATTKKAAPATPLERALDQKHGTASPSPKLKAKTSRREDHPFHDLNLKDLKSIEVPSGSLVQFGPRGKGEHHSGAYHGNFIPQVAEFILQRWTKRGDTVLDMFAGSGTALVECARLGRNYLGTDIQSAQVKHCRELAGKVANPDGVRLEVARHDACGDSIAEWVEKTGQVDHVILHPPYWNIIKFSSESKCLSNDKDLNVFGGSMCLVASNAFRLLKPGKWATMVISEIFVDGELVDLPADCANEMKGQGFLHKAKIVKDILGNEKGKGKDLNLWRYRAYDNGFAIFQHEYILAFQKPLERGVNA